MAPFRACPEPAEGAGFEHNPATNRSTSYYAFGAGPVAMRVMTGVITGSVVTWLHGDHLGSASLTTNASGQRVSEMRYKPFGEPRWITTTMATDKTFTGQRAEAGLSSLMDYNARMYSPVLGRFLSADSVVPKPDNPQHFNRYSYVLGNPLRFIDPTGHNCRDAGASEDECRTSGGGGAGVGWYVDLCVKGSRVSLDWRPNQTRGQHDSQDKA